MMIVDHLAHGHRALRVGVLRAVLLLVLGVWGVVKLVEGDWFIGGVLLACVLLGVPSLVSTVRRIRREELTGR
jgi:hypothetical protein